MNLFACDQKIEHLNDDFYGEGIPLSSNDPAHLFEIGDLSFAEGARVVHLRKVRTDAGGDTGCTGDQLWVLLVRDGAATGRNIHQKGTEEAVRMAAACHAIICEGASVDEALALYQG